MEVYDLLLLSSAPNPGLSARLDLRLTAIEAARTKLLADHREDLEHDEMATLMAELDLEEQQIRVAMGER
jgi:CPA1 family monovalent cation:H+ antiporter